MLAIRSYKKRAVFREYEEPTFDHDEAFGGCTDAIIQPIVRFQLWQPIAFRSSSLASVASLQQLLLGNGVNGEQSKESLR